MNVFTALQAENLRSKMSAGPVLPVEALEENHFLTSFQLLLTPGDSWLVAAALLFCLHLCRACPHLPVSLFSIFLTRIAVIG